MCECTPVVDTRCLSSAAFHPCFFFRQNLTVNLRFVDSARLCGQRASGLGLSISLAATRINAEVIGLHYYMAFL